MILNIIEMRKFMRQSIAQYFRLFFDFMRLLLVVGVLEIDFHASYNSAVTCSLLLLFLIFVDDVAWNSYAVSKSVFITHHNSNKPILARKRKRIEILHKLIVLLWTFSIDFHFPGLYSFVMILSPLWLLWSVRQY